MGVGRRIHRPRRDAVDGHELEREVGGHKVDRAHLQHGVRRVGARAAREGGPRDRVGRVQEQHEREHAAGQRVREFEGQREGLQRVEAGAARGVRFGEAEGEGPVVWGQGARIRGVDGGQACPSVVNDSLIGRRWGA